MHGKRKGEAEWPWEEKISEEEISHSTNQNFLRYLHKFNEKWIDPSKELLRKGWNDFHSMFHPEPKIFWLMEVEGMPFREVPFSNDFSGFDASKVEGGGNLYRLYRHGTGFYDEKSGQIYCTSISKERERKDFAGIIHADLSLYEKEKSEYLSFWEWMANRNEARYIESWDEEKTCDMKNLMHCMRLIMCAESIARSGIPKVEFKGEEREFLMRIRNGKENATEILKEAERKMDNLKDLFANSSIPHSVDKLSIKRRILYEVYPKLYPNLKLK